MTARRLGVLRWVLAAIVALGLFGSLGAGMARAASAVDAPDAKAEAEHQKAMQMIPEGMRQYYDGYWYFSSVFPNSYADWTPPPPPWQFCLNDFYQGNSWQAAVVGEYKKLVDQYAKAGLANPNLIISDSNTNIDVQLSQLNNMVRQGCNVIISIPSSSTGLCSGVTEARKKGILFITVASPVSCPEAINTDLNEYWSGRETASWLVDAMGKKGNVVLTNGVAGIAVTTARRAGALDVIKKNPDVHVLGEISGNWTPSVAKTEMVKFLATHPQKVDAIWDSGLMGVGASQALAQSGRPPAKVNGLCGECSFLAYWKDQKLDSFSLAQDGGASLYEGFLVAIYMLNGQKPVANTLLYPLPTITNANFDQWYKPDMTIESNCFAAPPGGRFVADDFFAPFFTGGQKPPVMPIP